MLHGVFKFWLLRLYFELTHPTANWANRRLHVSCLGALFMTHKIAGNAIYSYDKQTCVSTALTPSQWHINMYYKDMLSERIAEQKPVVVAYHYWTLAGGVPACRRWHRARWHISVWWSSTRRPSSRFLRRLTGDNIKRLAGIWKSPVDQR